MEQSRLKLDRMVMRLANQNQNPSTLSQTLTIEIVRSGSRLLKLSSDFGYLWDWSSFMAFVQDEHQSSELRFYSRRCLELKLGVGYDVSVGKDTDKDTDYEQQESLQRLLEIEESAVGDLEMMLVNDMVSSQATSHLVVTAKDLPSHLVDVCGIILYRSEDTTNNDIVLSTPTFVYTPTSRSNLKGVALAVSQRRSVLLSGNTGSGKTATVDELARCTNNNLGTLSSSYISFFLSFLLSLDLSLLLFRFCLPFPLSIYIFSLYDLSFFASLRNGDDNNSTSFRCRLRR